jgi:DNA-binding transcriptional ArsR family regulator
LEWGAERMLAHSNLGNRTTAAALAALIALAGAAQAEDEPDEAPSYLDYCMSTGACQAVNGAYDVVFDFLDQRSDQGLEGLLRGVATPTPDSEALFAFERVAQESVAATAAQPAPSTDAQHLAPGASMYLLVVEGDSAQANAAGPGVPAATLHDLAADLPVRAATDELNAAVDSAPVRPRDTLLDLVASISSIRIPGLPAIAATPAPGPDGEQAPPAADAVPVGQPPADALPVVRVREETLGARDIDRATAAPIVPDATMRSAPLESLAGTIRAMPLGDGTFVAVAAAAVITVLLLIPPLYHRLHRHQLLEHPARSKLYELVAGRPGIHIEELARASGCSRSTAVYHLRLLARNGYVVAVGSAKSVHYYPNNGHQDPTERDQRALLSSPRTRAIAQLVAAQPGIPRSAISAAVGVSASTLSWHLGRLLEKGLVEDRLVGGGRALFPSAGLAEMLQPWATAPAAPPGAPAPAEPAAPAEPLLPA